MTPEDLGLLGHRFARRAREADAARDPEAADEWRECADIARAEGRHRREQAT